MLTGRGYVVMMIIVFLVFGAIGHFAGPQMIRFINDTMNGARGFIGDLVVLVGEPLKWVFSNPLVGSIAIAVFWPLGAVFVGLFLIMMLIALGGGAVGGLGNSVQGLNP